MVAAGGVGTGSGAEEGKVPGEEGVGVGMDGEGERVRRVVEVVDFLKFFVESLYSRA